MNKETVVPSHVYAAIFQKITDPKKLLKLRLVSKQLKPEIETALKLADWKGLCENDIGHYALSTIIKPTFSKYSYNDFNDIKEQSKWRKVYYTYLNWCTYINCDNHIRQFSTKSLMWNRFFAHDNNTITCLDVWSGYIAGGSTKGTIHVFANFFLIKPHYIIKTGVKKINKVKIWFTASEELLVVSLDDDGYVRFWDVKEKTEKFGNIPKITNGIDLYINTSRNLYVVKQNQVLRLQLLPTCKNQLKLSQWDFNFSEEPSRILTLNFFEPHKISVLVRDGMMFEYYSNVYDEPEGLNTSNLERDGMPYMYVELFWRFYSFDNQAIMYVNDNCLINLNHLDYWKTFPMKSLFGGKITSIAWYGHYLLLGFDYGEIRIFYIEELAYLEEDISVLDNTQVKTIKLDSKPVIDMKIGRILDMPVIIAATENYIHKIVLEK